MTDEPNRADFSLPENVYEHIADALKGNSWLGADVIEFADYLLFPSTLKKRKADGSFEQIDVRLRVPREHEMRKARAEAISIMKEDGLDPKHEPDLLKNVETFCILQQCIRNTTDPYEPLVEDARILERRYDKSALIEVWAHIDALNRLIDPRPNALSSAEVLALIVAVSREGHTGPLAVYGPPAQASFIVTTAKLCMLSLESESFMALLTDLKGDLSEPQQSSPH